VSVQRYADLEAVFDAISVAPYGLQCGVFTKSLDIGLRAVRSLRVGGVIINGTSTWRADQMPYGGIRASGIGREGPHYAVREMTEERLAVFNI
jgi:acyl-CoA reductase-like NAD-dependent aldehyde dehydrogenase